MVDGGDWHACRSTDFTTSSDRSDELVAVLRPYRRAAASGIVISKAAPAVVDDAIGLVVRRLLHLCKYNAITSLYWLGLAQCGGRDIESDMDWDMGVCLATALHLRPHV